MKKYILLLVFSTFMLFVSCGNDGVETIDKSEQSEEGEDVKDVKDNNKDKNPVGAIELTRFQSYTSEFSMLEPNTLHIIRSEEEFQNLLNTDRQIVSGVDYDNNTVLVVDINSVNAFDIISYGLTKTSEGLYSYKVYAVANDTTAIGREILVVIAPYISQDSMISLDLRISNPDVDGGIYKDTGNLGVPLIRYTETNSFSELESNKLFVVRSEEEFQALSNTTLRSGIDYSRNTLLLTRVSTSNGIQEIAYWLMTVPEGAYVYGVDVTTDYTMMIGNEVFGIVVPLISRDETTFFSFSTQGGSSYQHNHYNEVGDIKLTRFAEGYISQSKLDYNTLLVVRSESEFKALIGNDPDIPQPDIDYSKNTLLLVRISTNNGINLISYGLSESPSGGYQYSVNVLNDFTDVIINEVLGVVAPLIKPEETVSFKFKVFNP